MLYNSSSVALTCGGRDPVAQPVEHLTFNQFGGIPNTDFQSLTNEQTPKKRVNSRKDSHISRDSDQNRCRKCGIDTTHRENYLCGGYCFLCAKWTGGPNTPTFPGGSR